MRIFGCGRSKYDEVSAGSPTDSPMHPSAHQNQRRYDTKIEQIKTLLREPNWLEDGTWMAADIGDGLNDWRLQKMAEITNALDEWLKTYIPKLNAAFVKTQEPTIGILIPQLQKDFKKFYLIDFDENGTGCSIVDQLEQINSAQHYITEPNFSTILYGLPPESDRGSSNSFETSLQFFEKLEIGYEHRTNRGDNISYQNMHPDIFIENLKFQRLQLSGEILLDYVKHFKQTEKMEQHAEEIDIEDQQITLEGLTSPFTLIIEGLKNKHNSNPHFASLDTCYKSFYGYICDTGENCTHKEIVEKAEHAWNSIINSAIHAKDFDAKDSLSMDEWKSIEMLVKSIQPIATSFNAIIISRQIKQKRECFALAAEQYDEWADDSGANASAGGGSSMHSNLLRNQQPQQRSTAAKFCCGLPRPIKGRMSASTRDQEAVSGDGSSAKLL